MKDLSVKEKEIFDGILSLAQKGENIFTLKVQQIADAAGVGKGTLYEYFSSRDEILAKALIYSMEIQILHFSAKISKETGFENKLYAALDFAHQSVTDNSAGAIFTNAMRNSDLREKLMGFCNKRDEFMKKLYAVLLQVVEVGRAEGKASTTANDGYCLMVIVSALCTVMFTSSQGGFDTWENIRENAFKMMCKALA